MQSRGGAGGTRRSPKATVNLRSAWELIIFGDGPKVFASAGQTVTMPEPEKDVERPDNVVSLGTESMVAIAEELRRMYAAYLREKPPDGLPGSCARSSVARIFQADDVS